MAKQAGNLSLLAAVLLIAGCSMIPNLGKDEEVLGNKDDRVAVLKVDSFVSADKSMEKVSVVVPSAETNTRWYKSSGFDDLIPQNIRAPLVFGKQMSVSIGHGAEKGQNLTAAPVIADNRIFTLDIEGQVTSYDVGTMQRQWRITLPLPEDKVDTSSAGMLYHQGRLYVATGYNVVVALNAADGQVVWKRSINSIARAAPDLSNNILFVNTIDNTLYALGAEDGAINWTHNGTREEVSVFGAASPVVSNNVVLAPYSSGELYALKITDGSELWYDSLTVATGKLSYSFSDIDATPIAVGNTVYAISNDGVLTASEIFSGHRLWEQEVAGNKTPWFAGGFLYLINDKNEVICIQASSGGVKWVSQLSSYRKPENKVGQIQWSGPVMAGDRLLVVGSNGQLVSISPTTGDIVGKVAVPKDIFLPPVVAYDQVFLLSNNANLTVLRGSDVVAQVADPIGENHAQDALYKKVVEPMSGEYTIKNDEPNFFKKAWDKALGR